MSDLNMVQLIGRLGADPEVRYTASGEAVANLRIATGQKWRDKQTGEPKESTEWHRVVFFKRQAEVASEFLKKGSQVYIRGELRTRKWEDQSGQDRYTTEILGRELSMLGGKAASTEGEEKPAAKKAAPAEGGFREKPAAEYPDQGDAFTDDDIPF